MDGPNDHIGLGQWLPNPDDVSPFFELDRSKGIARKTQRTRWTKRLMAATRKALNTFITSMKYD